MVVMLIMLFALRPALIPERLLAILSDSEEEKLMPKYVDCFISGDEGEEAIKLTRKSFI